MTPPFNILRNNKERQILQSDFSFVPYFTGIKVGNKVE